MLTNEVALVTGGSRGIGEAISFALARNNAMVAVNYTSDVAAAKKTVETIIAMGKKAVACQADISKYDQVEEMIKKIEEELGQITILVNNAGVTRDGLMMKMKEEDWDKVLDINLKGAYNCIKHCMRKMVKNKKGNIINISSIVGIVGNPGQCNYSASKAGLIGLTKSLAKEVGNRGIRVNCIAPGFIATSMTEQLPADMIDKIKGQISLGSLGTVENIADVVLFLVSPSASYITGEVIKVDGGLNI